MKLLYRYINYFGFFYGLKLFLKIIFGRTNNLKLPKYKYSFDLRSKTTDIAIFYQIFFNQSYEMSYGSNIKIIIDAGANIGLASIFFSNKFPNAKIIAIEPQRENFTLLCENTNRYENIIPIEKALWGNIETVSIIDQGYHESGFMVYSSKKIEEKNCATLTVDSILKTFDIGEIDILKIDIEGSEKEVFKHNTESWLPRVRCLIIELHDDMKPGSSKAVFKAISKYNFRLNLRGENLFFFNLDLL